MCWCWLAGSDFNAEVYRILHNCSWVLTLRLNRTTANVPMSNSCASFALLRTSCPLRSPAGVVCGGYCGVLALLTSVSYFFSFHKNDLVQFSVPSLPNFQSPSNYLLQLNLHFRSFRRLELYQTDKSAFDRPKISISVLTTILRKSVFHGTFMLSFQVHAKSGFRINGRRNDNLALSDCLCTARNKKSISRCKNNRSPFRC